MLIKSRKTSTMVAEPLRAIRWRLVVIATASAFCALADDGKREGRLPERVPLQVEDRLILTADDVAGLSRERLIEMMGADLPWSRKAAAQVLAKRGESSIPIFEQALADPDGRVTRAGLDGLLALLANARKDKNEELQDAVAETVASLGKTLVNDHYYVRMGALQVLGELGTNAAEAAADVCRLFTDEDFMGVAPTAIKTMAAIGVEHVDREMLMKALGQAVRSEHDAVRRAAMGVVSKLKEEQQRRLIPDMLTALRTPMKDGYTRFHLQGRIANLLYELGEKEALPLSIAILCQDGWGHTHRVDHIVPVLEKFGPDAVSALPVLERYLKRYREDPTKRALLERAIAKIKGEDP